MGQILVVFDVGFLVVGLPSIVLARLGFQDLVFRDLTSMLSFIARGQLHSLLILFRLLFPLCFLISLQLSLLLASVVALPFTMLTTPGLDNVFVRICYVGFEGYFWSQAYFMISRWLVSIILF